MVLAQPHCTSAKSGDSFRESPLLFELRRADVAATVRSVYIVCTEEKFKKGGDSLVWPSGGDDEPGWAASAWIAFGSRQDLQLHPGHPSTYRTYSYSV